MRCKREARGGLVRRRVGGDVGVGTLGGGRGEEVRRMNRGKLGV